MLNQTGLILKNLFKWWLLLSSFYRLKKWGTERLRKLPKTTQQVSIRAEITTQVVWLWSLYATNRVNAYFSFYSSEMSKFLTMSMYYCCQVNKTNISWYFEHRSLYKLLWEVTSAFVESWTWWCRNRREVQPEGHTMGTEAAPENTVECCQICAEMGSSCI